MLSSSPRMNTAGPFALLQPAYTMFSFKYPRTNLLLFRRREEFLQTLVSLGMELPDTGASHDPIGFVLRMLYHEFVSQSCFSAETSVRSSHRWPVPEVGVAAFSLG